jgi:hypothetical protein
MPRAARKCELREGKFRAKSGMASGTRERAGSSAIEDSDTKREATGTLTRAARLLTLPRRYLASSNALARVMIHSMSMHR